MAINEKSLANLANGAATQFGGERGNTPQPDKAWSIRNQMRRLAALEIDPENPDAVKNLGRGRKMTLARHIAAKLMQKAAEGELPAIQAAIDNVDGKPVQTNQNVSMTLEQLVMSSYATVDERNVQPATPIADDSDTIAEIEANGILDGVSGVVSPVSQRDHDE